jgi:methoxymalonate biosynthesis acyl carrier protein
MPTDRTTDPTSYPTTAPKTDPKSDPAKPAIRAFLARFFGEHRIEDDDDIFATGFVNSLFIMQLVLFVESEFALTVEDEDLEIENFNTVDAVAALVARKRSPSVNS